MSSDIFDAIMFLGFLIGDFSMLSDLILLGYVLLVYTSQCSGDSPSCIKSGFEVSEFSDGSAGSLS